MTTTLARLLLAASATTLLLLLSPAATANAEGAAPAPNVGTCITVQPEAPAPCSGGLVCIQPYPYSRLCQLEVGNLGREIVFRPIVRVPVPPRLDVSP